MDDESKQRADHIKQEADDKERRSKELASSRRRVEVATQRLNRLTKTEGEA